MKVRARSRANCISWSIVISVEMPAADGTRSKLKGPVVLRRGLWDLRVSVELC
jgi:hypothetical protein